MPSFPRAEQGREAEQTELHPREGFPEVLKVFLTAWWVERSKRTGRTKKGPGYRTAPRGRGELRHSRQTTDGFVSLSHRTILCPFLAAPLKQEAVQLLIRVSLL